MIEVFTDGSSLGNPGKGGYGIIMRMKGTSYIKKISEGFRLTTNNRMELLAVIIALEKIKKDHQQVVVYSDSKYVVNAVRKGWINSWKKKRFDKVKNPDLWIRFLKTYSNHTVHFEWIKGHAGHPENEECDKMAVNAAKSEKLSIDIGYENIAENKGELFD